MVMCSGSWERPVNGSMQPPCCMVTHKRVDHSCDLGPHQSDHSATITGSTLTGYQIHAVASRERFAQTGKCLCGSWPGSQLTWKPSFAVGCTYPRQWDAMEFCKALGKRRMHMIGDSTMFQIAATLINHIVLDAAMIGQTRQLPIHGNRSVSQQRLLECAGQLSFATADTLVGRSFGFFNRGAHWTQEVRVQCLEDGPSVVVLGASAHIGKGVDYRQLLADIAAGMASFTNVTFLWATSVPGGCAAKATPLPPGVSPQFWEITMNRSFDESNGTWHFREFYSQTRSPSNSGRAAA